ncbi:beta-N-acetylhexosaminidase [Motiliproteus sediminis]|uniref:beta-N-acetylhexosaminidase n=1 Tax=Motiliproteus sediminis TaxID=1468178 RepID=UPI001FEA920E|nr:beta-N-acetylhexosaminidase [Motiliproteus sediminis]
MSVAGPLMLDLQGQVLTEQERSLLLQPAVGGVILFSRNYQDPIQLRQLTAAIRALRPELLIAVDHEGGRVQRFRSGFTRIPAMAALGRLCAEDSGAALALARDCGWLLAAELIASGVDFSFAPVLDLDHGISAVIGDRAFGAQPEQVIALAGELMAGMHEAGMATTGKHFPGHGGVEADSHVAIPVDNRDYATIERQDLRPFARFARQGMDAVMPAHVIYAECDSQPAGFSSFWLQQVLRQRLGFDGVIFSDDLSMEGAVVAGSYPERAWAALDAGCDMVLVCNQPQAAREVLDWLQQQDVRPSSRLTRMKARPAESFANLAQHPRWQRCVAQLQQLDAETV